MSLYNNFVGMYPCPPCKISAIDWKRGGVFPRVRRPRRFLQRAKLALSRSACVAGDGASYVEVRFGNWEHTLCVAPLDALPCYGRKI